MRLVPALLLAVSLSAQSAPADEKELARTASSPYTLAKFIDDHNGGDLSNAMMWYLGVREDPDPCVGPDDDTGGCHVEFVPVDGQPNLMIARIDYRDVQAVLLRYRRTGERWKLAGTYNPWAKFFRPTAKLTKLGGRPFLMVEREESEGTGVYGKAVSAFDLAWKRFKPAVEYNTLVRLQYWSDWPWREVEGEYLSFNEAGNRQTVRIGYRVRFSHQLLGSGSLGNRKDVAAYSRTGSGTFRFDPSQSSASKRAIDFLYGYGADDPNHTHRCAFLEYAFENFRNIAAGPGGPPKEDLAAVVKQCSTTPAGRELLRVLAGK